MSMTFETFCLNHTECFDNNKKNQLENMI